MSASDRSSKTKTGETGWKHSMMTKWVPLHVLDFLSMLRCHVFSVIRQSPKNADRIFMESALNDLIRHPRSWPFRDPVKASEVADYYDVIKQPMGISLFESLMIALTYQLDFQTMGEKLKDGKYKTVDLFENDVRLIIENCRSYNPETTVYYKNADKIEEVLNDLIAKRLY